MGAQESTVELWRYRVTEVWGAMVGRVKVGEFLVDDFREEDERIWQFINMTTGEMIGGIAGDRIEPYQGREEQSL